MYSIQFLYFFLNRVSKSVTVTNKPLDVQNAISEKYKSYLTTFGNKFDFEYDYELPNGEIVPFIVTCFQTRKLGIFSIESSVRCPKTEKLILGIQSNSILSILILLLLYETNDH